MNRGNGKSLREKALWAVLAALAMWDEGYRHLGRGAVWLGRAWRGKVRRGRARHGLAGRGKVGFSYLFLAILILLLAQPIGADPEPLSDNTYLVALTVLFEATGQPPLGQELVAHVVANRAERLGTPHYETVVFADGQFIAWTEGRKRGFLQCQIEHGNDPACFDAMALAWLGSAPDARERWLDLLAMSMAVVGGAPEPVGFEGATHFDNPRFWASGEPPWAYSKQKLGCICDHCFYR